MPINRFSLPAGDARYAEAAARIDHACGITDAEGNPKPSVSPPVNLTAIHRMTGTSRIVFRAVPYEVPPLGFEAGATLLHLRATLAAVLIACNGTNPRTVANGLKDLITTCTALIGLFKRHTRPVRWRDRVRWHWRGFNPFQKIELEEVDALTDFFCSCLTRSSVRTSLAAPPHFIPPISQTTLPSSPARTPRGASRRRGRRSPGPTSTSE